MFGYLNVQAPELSPTVMMAERDRKIGTQERTIKELNAKVSWHIYVCDICNIYIYILVYMCVDLAILHRDADFSCGVVWPLKVEKLESSLSETRRQIETLNEQKKALTARWAILFLYTYVYMC